MNIRFWNRLQNYCILKICFRFCAFFFVFVPKISFIFLYFKRLYKQKTTRFSSCGFLEITILIAKNQTDFDGMVGGIMVLRSAGIWMLRRVVVSRGRYRVCAFLWSVRVHTGYWANCGSIWCLRCTRLRVQILFWICSSWQQVLWVFSANFCASNNPFACYMAF